MDGLGKWVSVCLIGALLVVSGCSHRIAIPGKDGQPAHSATTVRLGEGDEDSEEDDKEDDFNIIGVLLDVAFASVFGSKKERREKQWTKSRQRKILVNKGYIDKDAGPPPEGYPSQFGF